MGNMFKCVLASGTGNGIPLIVTCTSVFAGVTITCSDGTTTLTDTCPSSSPYEITFNLPNKGTWTVSGVISGQTYYAYKTISDAEVELTNVPDGATVTPTNDVQILLNCANIWDKAYTTISQLLADTTSLLAVISDNNAVDYLVRSTTFASSVCANSTAMTYIGADDYCADTLLSNSTWRTAICNSTYFESVLNVKVPTMTNDTTPSGVASASTVWQSGYDAWKAFNGNTSQATGWISNTSNAGQYIDYQFTRGVRPIFFDYKGSLYSGSRGLKAFKIQGSNDGTNYTDLTNEITNSDSNLHSKTSITKNNSTTYTHLRLYTTQATGTSAYQGVAVLQFYGRA